MILLVLVTLLSHEIIAQGGIFDSRAGIFDLIKFPVSLHKILEFRRIREMLKIIDNQLLSLSYVLE